MKNKTLLLMTVLGLSAATMYGQSSGLKGEYYDGQSFDRKVTTRIDRKIDFTWDNVAPAKGINPQEFSIRWTGKIKAPKSGDYMFRAEVDDGIRVRVNGEVVISAWGLNDEGKFIGHITLEAGKMYDLQVDYFNGLVEGEIKLFWQLPGDEPTFGGLLGYNDKIIDAGYFYQPDPKPEPPAKPKEEAKKPATTPQKVPKEKPTAKKETREKLKPEPIKAPAPQPVSKDSIERYKPKNVLFEQSKNTMLPGSMAELDRLAAFLNRHPELKVRIEGHTDVLGDPAKNLELSKIRTQRVKKHLEGQGVAASRIVAEGFGSTRPVKGGELGSNKNRRVVFIIE